MTNRAGYLLLFASLFFGSIVSAQTTQDYADGFCSHYEYSVDCYTHRAGVERKVNTFATNLISGLESQPASYALVRMRDLDDQLAEYQTYYGGTHREYLILLLRNSFYGYLLEVEEEVDTISLTADYLQSQWTASADQDAYMSQMRRLLLSQLVDRWFDWFVQEPYGVTDTSGLLLADVGSDAVFVQTPLLATDPLDMYLQQHFGDMEDIQDIALPPSMYRDWAGQIHLFKSTQDLEALWYTLVSHRTRTNNDEAYRRTNIATAFDEIGHVRVLNPGDEISFMQDSNFDPGAQQLYQDGFVIFLDEEVEDYGGGLCGGSTAIYQGIVTNKSLSRPALRNHSKRYHHLYDATIDGELISTPGIDSTIYSNSLDLRLRNTANHPIILVLNYEWWAGETEEVFTVWYPSDRWYVKHVSSRPYSTTLNVKWWGSRKVNGECHTWNINWQERESCYKEVKK